jgi:hypothetical protein
MKISKAKARLDKLLIREGFDFNHPDLIKGYQAFKAFAKETVECKEELFYHRRCWVIQTKNSTANRLHLRPKRIFDTAFNSPLGGRIREHGTIF